MVVPAISGAPVPYWPTVVIKPDTVRGVGTYFVNLILDILFSVCALVVGISAVVFASSSDPIAAIGFIATLGAATCGLIVVFVINFILSLMSVLRMHSGASEYGPEHAANARWGVTFKWIGTTLSTLAAISVVYLIIFVNTAVFFGGGGVPATVYVPLIVTAFWTAGVTAKAQMYRFMVRSLQPPETRRWSDLAATLIPALGLIGVGLVGYYTVRVIDLISIPSSVTAAEAGRLFQLLIGGVFLPPGLALVGYIIFLVVYGKTRDRLSSGLDQLYRSVPPPAAWAFVPPAPPATAAPPEVGVMAPETTGEEFCSRCGHPFAAGALFCLNCGARRASSPAGPA